MVSTNLVTIQAGPLPRIAYYRTNHAHIESTYLWTEIEGSANWSSVYAGKILDEVQQGKGQLKDMGAYLFNAAAGADPTER